MARDGEIDALVEVVHQVGRPLHVVVLAAGVGLAGAFGSYPLRRLDTQFAVNLRAPFQLVQGLLPLLRAGAVDAPDCGARVVAIASITGVASAPGLAAYGATKAGLIALCESITAAEGTNGVSATAISPGYVDTDMTAWVRDELDPSDMIKVEDVAELAVAVCRLSRRATVPNIVVSRPGGQLWRP